MNKNTLYLSFDGLSDPLGRSQIIPYLCQIAQKGYNITIISCEKKGPLDRFKNDIEQILKQYQINWHPIHYDEQAGWLSRWQYLQKIKKTAIKLHQKNNFLLVHCRSYLVALVGLHFYKKFQKPFIFDMRGLWADERFDGGIWNRKNPLHQLFYQYFKRKEKEFIYHCGALVSLTQKGLDYLNKQFSSANLPKKSVVIPCSVDTHLFKPQETETLRKKLGYIPQDEIIVYSGSIGTWYLIKEMIDCVYEWWLLNRHIKLLVLTRDWEEVGKFTAPYQKEFKQAIKAISLSYNEVPAHLSLAQAAIFFIKPAFSKVASSPTKMAECWAVNLPVITNAGIGDNDFFIENSKGGVLIKTLNQEGYQKAYSQYRQIAQENRNYRKIAINHFGLEAAAQKYIELYNKLTLSGAVKNA